MPPQPPEASSHSQHFIIGTAGHVDHGKTSLIRALTGSETDRLREEQERGMSIDLGFTDFTLPSGRRAGVIDVPGHERFLKNMLAGAGGIDLVVLVIAADEGVMPQTREHLEILSILQTRKGVVAITKADMVDPEWLELVQDDIREALKGTFLAHAPMLPVSSITGDGIPELKALLDRLADEVPTRTIVGPWRLPIDRAFTIGGFGTVVTGTLISGIARVGDRVEILPERLETRVRGLQVHGASVEFAEAGTRVAMNLAGLQLEEVHRGQVAAPPGVYGPTLALDARLDVLESCPREVKNRTRVRVYLGTAEVLARLNLLDAETLEPGGSGLVQLRLEEPAMASKGDRYVLRFYSPMETIGGGAIIDPSPARHRRFDEAVLSNLTVKEMGTPDELVAEAVQRAGITPVAPPALAVSLGMPVEEVRRMVASLLERGELEQMGGETVLHRHRLDAAQHQMLSVLSEFHQSQPLLSGMSREELRSRMSRQMDAKGFNLILGRLEASGEVVSEGGRVRIASHEPQFTPEQRRVAEALEAGLLRDPFNAPSFEELRTSASLPAREAQVVWDALVSNGVVVRIAADVFLHRTAVEQAIEKVRTHLAEQKQMTASQFRDLLGTTRKYAVPLLEYLDAQRVTRRLGDVRELF
ncbi:MAG: selenocysteine-specific translation elongation factor [Armatimonadota bacterium]